MCTKASSKILYETETRLRVLVPLVSRPRRDRDSRPSLIIHHAHFCFVLLERIQMDHNYRRHLQNIYNIDRHVLNANITVLSQKNQSFVALDLVIGQDQDRLILQL